MKITKETLRQIFEEELKEAHIVRETKEDAEALKVILTNMVKAFAAGGDRAAAKVEVLKVVNKQLDLIVGEESKPMQETSDDRRTRGGYGSPTVKDIEGMLPAGVKDNTPGVASVLQRRALEAKMSKNDLAAKIKAAKIKDGEHPRQFFKRLGFKY
jgi:hypothetical protein